MFYCVTQTLEMLSQIACELRISSCGIQIEADVSVRWTFLKMPIECGEKKGNQHGQGWVGI